MTHFFRWIAVWFTSRVELHKVLVKLERERDTNLFCYHEVAEENAALLDRNELLEEQNLRLVHYLGGTGRGAADHEVIGLQAFWHTEGQVGIKEDWIEWEAEVNSEQF